MAWQDIYALVGSEWRSTFVPLMQGTITAQCEQQSLALGMAFDVESILAQEWFDEYTMAFAAEVIGETERELAGLLRQGQAEGWSIPTTEKNMGLMFRQWAEGGLTPAAFEWLEQRMPRYRRELISRTETIRSSNAGTNALYKDWGVQYKEWLATADARTCEWCLAMNGKIIPVGGSFWEKGQSMTVQVGDKTRSMTFGYETVQFPPLHPACRCCLIPWMSEWE